MNVRLSFSEQDKSQGKADAPRTLAKTIRHSTSAKSPGSHRFLHLHVFSPPSPHFPDFLNQRILCCATHLSFEYALSVWIPSPVVTMSSEVCTHQSPSILLCSLA
jgi:hypothetical protein